MHLFANVRALCIPVQTSLKIKLKCSISRYHKHIMSILSAYIINSCSSDETSDAVLNVHSLLICSQCAHHSTHTASWCTCYSVFLHSCNKQQNLYCVSVPALCQNVSYFSILSHQKSSLHNKMWLLLLLLKVFILNIKFMLDKKAN